LDQSHRAGCTVPGDQVEQVRRWIENYHQVKENLEKISDINRELMRRLKAKNKKRKNANNEPSGQGNEGRRLACLAALRMKERAHSLSSFSAWLNKGFDLRAHATQMADARTDPEISPSSIFLAVFHSFVFRLPSFSSWTVNWPTPICNAGLAPSALLATTPCGTVCAASTWTRWRPMLVDVNRPSEARQSLR